MPKTTKLTDKLKAEAIAKAREEAQGGGAAVMQARPHAGKTAKRQAGTTASTWKPTKTTVYLDAFALDRLERRRSTAKAAWRRLPAEKRAEVEPPTFSSILRDLVYEHLKD